MTHLIIALIDGRENSMPARLPSDWPQPEPVALAHSQRLAALIRKEMTREGPIDFARFMGLALYAPGLGYYSGGAHKFGPAGDFVTAPELSPLFAACLARQVAEVLAAGGDSVLELGAGSGVLVVQLLRELARLDAMPRRYLILETSAELRARQQQAVAGLPSETAARVQWLDALPAAPIDGVVFANEVADALPVRRFLWPDRALAVAPAGDGFDWVDVPADHALQTHLGRVEAAAQAPLAAGYRSEWSHRLAPWIASLADIVGRGVLLLVDYGMGRREYYHPERAAGTLMCYYRHRAHDDPLLLPGLQDITADVDFTALAEAGEAAGLSLLGYTTQAHFLIGCGLEAVMQALIEREGLGSRAQIAAASGVRRLMLPGEMGERFKVMALGRDENLSLRGLAARDFSAAL